MAGALDGIRIIDLTQGIAGPYTGMLLAEQGAQVVKVEPPQGDAARGTPGFHVWNRSKQSVAADAATAEGLALIRRLVAGADVVLTDFQPGSEDEARLGYDSLADNNPGLIGCHLPAFGTTGPHATRFADDTLVAALSGLLGSQWSHRAGGVYLVIPIASYGAAFVASGSIAAALFERERSSLGQRLEVSWLAGAFAMNTGTILYHPDILRLFSGQLDPLGPIPVYRLFQAQDDWLFVACGNPTFWNKFCLALDQTGWLSDPRYERAPWGIAAEDRQELADRISAIMRTRPRAEWLDILRTNDVPCAPVTSRQEFMEFSQVLHNRLRVEVDDPQLGHTVQMGVPVQLSRTPGAIQGPAPLLGQHTEAVKQNAERRTINEERRTEPSAPIRPAAGGAPLQGVVVLDFASYIAGTLGPMMLAQLGATVIKVESLSGDAFRAFGFGFLGWNQGKRGLSVNLNSPQGKQVVHDLVRKADVVVENLRPGATRRYGIDYDTLSALNPRLIYATVTAFGSSGPDHDYPGFDPLLQARSGIMRAQGGHGQPPFYLTCGVCDYAAALLTAYGVSAALYARHKTGLGQHIETSLTSAAMAVQAGNFIFYDGRPDMENGGPDLWGTGALYRIYPTADSSLFLAVTDEKQWRALGAVMDRPELSRQPFSQARQAGVDSPLGQMLTACFGRGTTLDWMATLDRAGVPCAPVLPLPDLFDDEHVAANELIATHTHPQWGEVRQTGILPRFSRTPAVLPYVAPMLGQHTAEVLRELAGYSQDTIDALFGQGVIHTAEEKR
jgi:crotonobetainyl-CoA:carnitine CoA-transferase CaiB-like acyl-CoA transferase